jgi:archaellum biogenesis ATPase FlaH
MGSEIKNYTKEIEYIFIQFFMTDSELFVRCLSIIDPQHFVDFDYRTVVSFMQNYVAEYSALPTIEQINAVTGVKIEKLDECGYAEKEWFLNEFETFARHKALEIAILGAPDLLEQHRYGEVESLVKKAVSIGLVKDLGLSYFENPLARLEKIANTRGATPLGFKDVDEKLYGGVNRGEITIFAGPSGSGKSVFLQNIAVNWANVGLTVVYISLELSENLCSMRIDAMQTGYASRELIKNKEDVDLKLRIIQKKGGGSLQIKQMRNGSTANDIRAYIKEYEIQSKKKVDAILLDYLDLCMPTNAKISPENLFVKDKYITENMRDLAVELDCLLVTASQLNRNARDEAELSQAHIAGGISKIDTADNVLAIFTTTAMKENGRYQLQFLKTRSSSGVGSKVDLGFDVKCLRIHDLSDTDIGSIDVNTNSIMNKIQQARSVVTDGDEKDEMEQKADNTKNSALKLRNMLGKIGK